MNLTKSRKRHHRRSTQKHQPFKLNVEGDESIYTKRAAALFSYNHITDAWKRLIVMDIDPTEIFKQFLYTYYQRNNEIPNIIPKKLSRNKTNIGFKILEIHNILVKVCIYAKKAGFHPYGYIYVFIESNKLFENEQIKFLFLDVGTIANLSVQAYNLIRSKPKLIRPITEISNNNNNNNKNKNSNNL